MTPRQAAAERAVINAARALERANQYGINAAPAAAEYERARSEQARIRRQVLLQNRRAAA